MGKLDDLSLKMVVATMKFADVALSKEVAKTVKTHAFIGAICMAIPLFGLETIIYIWALWSMYVKISKYAQVSFWQHFARNVLGAVIVNIAIALIFGIVLDFIPVAGWIVQGCIGYFSIFLSGCAYLEALARIHGKNNVSTGIDYKKGWEAMNKKENDDITTTSK